MNVLLAITEPVCPLCGHIWPRDPCFAVACPTCGANAGAYCKRPSGHSGPLVPFHAERDLAAAAAGAYAHPCVPDHRCTCCEATGAPLPVTLVAELVQPPLF